MSSEEQSLQQAGKEEVKSEALGARQAIKKIKQISSEKRARREGPDTAIGWGRCQRSEK